MTVALREARHDERPLLEQLLCRYLFEFDARTGGYPGLDAYWNDANRQRFLIEANGEAIGLCLIRRRHNRWCIAEFWVQADKRRGGVGRAAVEALAERGRAARADSLEAKVHPANQAALLFWLATGFREVDDSGTGVRVTRRPLWTPRAWWLPCVRL